MGKILDTLKGAEDKIFYTPQEIYHLHIYKQNKLSISEFRVCNAAKDSFYVKCYMDKDKKKLYFASKRVIETGSILVDIFQNIYRIIHSSYEKNDFLSINGKDVITTISDYEDYIPNNPIRNTFHQQATIDQRINGLNNIQNNGNIVLNIEQKAFIEQHLNTRQLIDSAEDEAKYRFVPFDNKEFLFDLIKDIVKGAKTINDLRDKKINDIIHAASGFLKEILDILIKKLKDNTDNEGYYKE